ncbi:MAG: hypothetical protein D6710_09195, partial [Nitrospirae bacterium]
PLNLSFFSGIDETPLFRWLKEADNLKLTWWIYGMIVLIGLLAINTIFCTVEGLLKRLSMKNLLLKLSPQIIHIGVLLIMLGHLLTASIGIKEDVFLKKGEEASIGRGVRIVLQDVSVVTDEEGYDIDWTSRVKVVSGSITDEIALKPSRPVYRAGFGFFVQAATRDEEEISSLIRVIDDPGVLWAMLGGGLVVISGVMFLIARIKQ